MQDTRFTGNARLCWFAFGDNSGRAGVESVKWWVNCDDGDAAEILEWMRDEGHLERLPDGTYFAPSLVANEFNVSVTAQRERGGPNRPKVSRSKRKRISDRDKWTCTYCGQNSGPFELDHVIPVSKGGSNKDENLVLSCQHCNRSKGATLVGEWKA